MIQVNENYYEDLNEKDMKNIIDLFMNDKPLKPGSYREEKNSAPENNKILGEGHALKKENKIFKHLFTMSTAGK